jgi:hypothetical protein
MTLRRTRPWIYFFAFLAGFGLLAKGTFEFPSLATAYRGFALVVILLFSIARLFEWWKAKSDSIDRDDRFTDRLFRHQLALQRRFHRWFYDEA